MRYLLEMFFQAFLTRRWWKLSAQPRREVKALLEAEPSHVAAAVLAQVKIVS